MALQGFASTYPVWDSSVKSYEYLAESSGVLTQFNSHCSTFPAHPQKNTHYLQPSLYLSVKTLCRNFESKQRVPSQRTASHRCCNKFGKAQAVWARKVLSPLQRPKHGMDSLGAPSRSSTPLRCLFHSIPWNTPASTNFWGTAFPFTWYCNFFTGMNHPFSPPLFLFHRICWNFSLAPSGTSCFLCTNNDYFSISINVQIKHFHNKYDPVTNIFLHSPFSFSFKE